jgi:hypothetical protein
LSKLDGYLPDARNDKNTSSIVNGRLSLPFTPSYYLHHEKEVYL